jgi:hypothetical protein
MSIDGRQNVKDPGKESDCGSEGSKEEIRL